MIKKILGWIKIIRLHIWINDMERILNKAEDKGQTWNNSYYKDLGLFTDVYNIDDHIEDCQESIRHMRILAKEFGESKE